jgi:hypothetical protein
VTYDASRGGAHLLAATATSCPATNTKQPGSSKTFSKPRTPDGQPLVRAERERARWRLHLVRHRSSLKQRVHAVLLTHGKPCPVSDLFGVRGRQLLTPLDLPQP